MLCSLPGFKSNILGTTTANNLNSSLLPARGDPSANPIATYRDDADEGGKVAEGEDKNSSKIRSFSPIIPNRTIPLGEKRADVEQQEGPNILRSVVGKESFTKGGASWNDIELSRPSG